MQALISLTKSLLDATDILNETDRDIINSARPWSKQLQSEEPGAGSATRHDMTGLRPRSCIQQSAVASFLAALSRVNNLEVTTERFSSKIEKRRVSVVIEYLKFKLN